MGEKIKEYGLKPKTIEKIIKNKMESWIYSFKNVTTEETQLLSDEEKETRKLELAEFRDRVRNNYIVTGGAIASMLTGELPNDYDIYFKDMAVAREVTEYYIKKLDKKVNDFVPYIQVLDREDKTGIYVKVKSMGIVSDSKEDTDDYKYFEQYPGIEVENYFEKHFKKPRKEETRKYHPILITGNAISLSDDIQIIIRFCGDPKDIHDNYDFAHCTNYFTKADGLVLNQDALIAIMTRELRYVGSKYPICSIFRTRKFIQRGWSITAGEMLKISYDINKLNLNDMNVFYEQLVGVDQAYFHQLIKLLTEGHKKGNTIDRIYIMKAIDTVFNDSDELEDALAESVLPEINDEENGEMKIDLA